MSEHEWLARLESAPQVGPFTSTQKTQDAAFNGLLASETVLALEWDSPEEDAAWASL